VLLEIYPWENGLRKIFAAVGFQGTCGNGVLVVLNRTQVDFDNVDGFMQVGA
jgi:hypothetical protein